MTELLMEFELTLSLLIVVAMRVWYKMDKDVGTHHAT
jgi:hypothetical protein